MKFHPKLEDVQLTRNESGDAIGWIGKMGDGYTWVVPSLDEPDVTPAPYGLMTISPHSGDGNMETRESARRMLCGMYERPRTYGFKRENWSSLWP